MTDKKQMAKKELEDLLKRVQADFENYRKRVEQDKQTIRQFANANLILDFLPVLDNFRRALARRSLGEGGTDNPWIQGIEAIERQFEEILRQNGLEEIAVKSGDQFNPVLHEAIAHEPANEHKPNSIVKVIERGYQITGKVLRPAKVVVS